MLDGAGDVTRLTRQFDDEGAAMDAGGACVMIPAKGHAGMLRHLGALATHTLVRVVVFTTRRCGRGATTTNAWDRDLANSHHAFAVSLMALRLWMCSLAWSKVRLPSFSRLTPL